MQRADSLRGMEDGLVQPLALLDTSTKSGCDRTASKYDIPDSQSAFHLIKSENELKADAAGHASSPRKSSRALRYVGVQRLFKFRPRSSTKKPDASRKIQAPQSDVPKSRRILFARAIYDMFSRPRRAMMDINNILARNEAMKAGVCKMPKLKEATMAQAPTQPDISSKVGIGYVPINEEPKQEGHANPDCVVPSSRSKRSFSPLGASADQDPLTAEQPWPRARLSQIQQSRRSIWGLSLDLGTDLASILDQGAITHGMKGAATSNSASQPAQSQPITRNSSLIHGIMQDDSTRAALRLSKQFFESKDKEMVTSEMQNLMEECPLTKTDVATRSFAITGPSLKIEQIREFAYYLLIFTHSKTPVSDSFLGRDSAGFSGPGTHTQATKHHYLMDRENRDPINGKMNLAYGTGDNDEGETRENCRDKHSAHGDIADAVKHTGSYSQQKSKPWRLGGAFAASQISGMPSRCSISEQRRRNELIVRRNKRTYPFRHAQLSILN